MDVTVEVLSDLDAAVSDLRSSISQDEQVMQRRSLRAALACIYELRSHRVAHEGDTFYSRENASGDGEVTLAMVWLRGRHTHQLVHRAHPTMVGLYPGPNTFPGENTYPGAHLCWSDPSAIPASMQHDGKGRRAAYEQRLVGQPVLEGFAAARRFLAPHP